MQEIASHVQRQYIEDYFKSMCNKKEWSRLAVILMLWSGLCAASGYDSDSDAICSSPAKRVCRRPQKDPSRNMGCFWTLFDVTHVVCDGLLSSSSPDNLVVMHSVTDTYRAIIF